MMKTSTRCAHLEEGKMTVPPIGSVPRSIEWTRSGAVVRHIFWRRKF
jgi:hypothetical protein